MRFSLTTYLILFSTALSKAQLLNPGQDSSRFEIEPVHIQTYFSQQPLLTYTSSAKVLSAKDIISQAPHSYLSAINNVAGVRMEERSPGSYRLAIRGSMIRSSFGVRNIKIYMDEFSFTDAGGNTYLNLLDPMGTHSLHIHKGPDGSIYGPNSGGIIQLSPNGFEQNLKNKAHIQLTGGSYGSLYQSAGIAHKLGDSYQFSIDQSFSRSNGYRENSGLNKKTIQTAHKWQYTENATLKWFGLYSNMHYQTPGALTQQQYEEDPKMARPDAGAMPGASTQQAGIYNTTWFGGINHFVDLSSKWAHQISIFGSATEFENPFITNYEYRKERNMGLRTFLSYKPLATSSLKWNSYLGFEGQKGKYEIKNYDNDKGKATDPQAFDNLYNAQATVFFKNTIQVLDRWTLEASLGWNSQSLSFEETFPAITTKQKVEIKDAWMPRLGISYLWNDHMAWRASISKGFSPPTIAEVRGSDNVINTGLEPEEGTNYEIGWRWHTHDRSWIADLSTYVYKMKNGIIRQMDEQGADFYRNAGVINQKGMEASLLAYLLKPDSKRKVNSIYMDTNLTLQRYRFGDYKVGKDDFTGNNVTAVPEYIWSSSISIDLWDRYQLNVLHNLTSSLPLNDANTFYSKSYDLLQAKLEYNRTISGLGNFTAYLGTDNLLNEKYSLGNDINAFGNRFFNASPPRNYYVGVRIEI